ncbi:hypothetical protein [Actinophytocola sp.]|jgi:hypothetical protein|uniref:hypothetical protein n=1 Tax=Actinophytocola sp. TaxID=1872138 RepID=UPI002EDB5D34
MSDANRPPGGGGRRGIFRRAPRESVPYDGSRYFDPWLDDDDDDDGSAGVREPRRPKPLGPMSDAGALPEPEPPMMISLPDPRR